MATKYRVSASFDLTTEIEPDGIEGRIESAVQDIEGAENFESGSYFSGQTVTCDGGQVSIEIEADDEDTAVSMLREAIEDGMEYEDYNGFTWLVESCDYEIEALEEEPPTVEEAIEILARFAETHLSEADEDHERRLAQAIRVVLDDHARLGRVVAEVSIAVRDLQQKVATLQEQNDQQRTSIEALTAELRSQIRDPQ